MIGRAERVGVAALLAVFAVLAVASMRGKNPTFDETAHLAAGISYVQTGDFRMNAEHPVLPKLLAGATASLSGVRVPTDSTSWREGEQWDFGRDLLYGQGVPWPRIVLLGRLPMVALGVLAGLLLWRWSRAMVGPAGAAFALALWSFCPNVLAHTRLVTTDVPLTLCVLGTTACLWAARETGAARWIAGAAAFVALSMVTKFSAFSYAPVWAVLALVPSPARDLRRGAAHLVLLGVLSFAFTQLAVFLAYGFATDFVTIRSLGMGGRGVTPEGMSLLRRIPFEIMASVPWPSADFARGMKDIILFTEAGHPVYLLGKAADSGWWWSPLLTLAVKAPLPLLLAAAVAAGLLALGRAARRADLLFVLAPPALVLGTNVAANLGLGVRHLLPMFPFLMVLAAWPLRGRAPAGRAAAAVAAVLLWQAGGALAAHPHYLPFFNEVARVAGGGYRLLGDSNLDWGQDLSLAAGRLRGRGVDGAILCYFGTASPFVEGLDWQLLPPAPRGKRRDPWTVLPADGELWLAMSATNRQGIYYRAPGGGPPYPWLDGLEPVESVGDGTVFLYEISREGAALAGLAATCRRHGLIEEEERALERVVDVAPYDSASRRRLVELLLARGELERADTIIVDGPNPDVDMLLLWTSIKKRRGDDRATHEAYERSLRGFPNSAELKNAYAWWLQETGEDLDRALELATGAVEWEPGDPYFRDTLAMVHLARGDVAAALDELDRALAAPGGDLAAIRWHRVQALAAAGRRDEALAEVDALAAREDLEPGIADELEALRWELGG